MTHTLHRQGDEEELGQDYVLFAMASKDVNREGAAPYLRRFLEALLPLEPINFGDMKTGNKYSAGAEKILAGIKDNSIVHVVFDDPARLARAVDIVRTLDLGLSVVVSGLFEQVRQRCGPLHTVEFSLGVHGQTERIPGDYDGALQSISTMCGHGMVGYPIIAHLTDEVRAGRVRPENAALRLARLCHCGVFNPRRAEAYFRAVQSQAAARTA